MTIHLVIDGMWWRYLYFLPRLFPTSYPPYQLFLSSYLSHSGHLHSTHWLNVVMIWRLMWLIVCDSCPSYHQVKSRQGGLLFCSALCVFNSLNLPGHQKISQCSWQPICISMSLSEILADWLGLVRASPLQFWSGRNIYYFQVLRMY